MSKLALILTRGVAESVIIGLGAALVPLSSIVGGGGAAWLEVAVWSRADSGWSDISGNNGRGCASCVVSE